jgi:hypothetical protein
MGQMFTVSNGMGQMFTVSNGMGQMFTVSNGMCQMFTVSNGMGQMFTFVSVVANKTSFGKEAVADNVGNSHGLKQQDRALLLYDF